MGDSFEQHVEELVSCSEKSNHRRLLLVVGKKEPEAGFFEKLVLRFKDNVAVSKNPDVRRLFKKIITSYETQFETGTTHDLVFFDAWDDLDPKSLARMVETVRGGGLFVFSAPVFEDWVGRVTRFHSQLISPPFSPEDVRNNFVKRLVRKLLESDAVSVYDSDRSEWTKKASLKAKKFARKKIRIPERGNRRFARTVYDLCGSQGQVASLKAFEGFISRRKKALVLTSDRGRGKSSVLGIGAAALGCLLAKKARKKTRLVVTSVSKESVSEVFRFAEKTLSALGEKHSYNRERGVLFSRDLFMVYKRPDEALSERPDVLLVDEAAGIYPGVLGRLANLCSRTVFSTTVHGYEGTGRVFSLRFLPRLSKLFETKNVVLEEPIRYAENDPVEKWLFDALVLDAEPSRVTPEIVSDVSKKKTSLSELNMDECFVSKDTQLKKYFGIYVYAHYRNNPNDLVVLGDMPNQRAFALKTDGGKTVASLQIAREGSLPKDVVEKLLRGEKVVGNIVPDLLVKYYGFLDFADTVGHRVVRIAVHPELFGHGLGSRALGFLEEKVEGDWLGASFGATGKLLDFWEKNGYLPVHISPKRGASSGEYNVLVLKAKKPVLELLASEANSETKRRLLAEASNYYKFLEPDAVIRVLKSGARSDFSPLLSKHGFSRAEKFVEGVFHFEAASDALQELAEAYFLSQSDSLSPEEELLVVKAVLQRHQWSYLLHEFSCRDFADVFEKLRNAFAKIVTLGSRA